MGLRSLERGRVDAEVPRGAASKGGGAAVLESEQVAEGGGVHCAEPAQAKADLSEESRTLSLGSVPLLRTNQPPQRSSRPTTPPRRQPPQWPLQMRSCPHLLLAATRQQFLAPSGHAQQVRPS